MKHLTNEETGNLRKRFWQKPLPMLVIGALFGIVLTYATVTSPHSDFVKSLRAEMEAAEDCTWNDEDTANDVKNVNCPMWFSDMDGYSIGRNDDGQWELGADRDVLVWFNLPTNINELDISIESSYPYEVKKGETGTIEVEAIQRHDGYKLRLYGSLEFVAQDDLTIGSLSEDVRRSSAEVIVANDSVPRYEWMADDKHAYFNYPLYTSCEKMSYGVNRVQNDVSGGGDMYRYKIIPVGAPEITWNLSDVEPQRKYSARKAPKKTKALPKSNPIDDWPPVYGSVDTQKTTGTTSKGESGLVVLPELESSQLDDSPHVPRKELPVSEGSRHEASGGMD